MPKIKEVVNNLVNDKEERAENAVQYFTSKGTDLCHKNGNKLTSEEAQHLSIGRIDASGEKLEEYYKGELNKQDIIPCNELHQSSTSEATEL